MERPVEFNSQGINLRGMLHTPDENPRGAGILFLNAGLVYRAGPHRLYINAARKLTHEGYTCLRLDFPGIGDSDGKVKEIPDADLFPNTSHTSDAVDFLMGEPGVQSVSVIATCTGARNALRTARRDPRLDSLILLSMPMTFDRTKTPTYRLLAGQAVKNKTLIPRLYQFAKTTFAWKFLIKGYFTLMALGAAYRGIKRATRKIVTRSGLGRTNYSEIEDFPTACAKILDEERRVFFIYAEGDDTLVKDFEQHVASRDTASHDESKKPFYDYWLVKGANHVFSGKEMQRSLIARMAEWLESDAAHRTDTEAEAARIGSSATLSGVSD